MLVDIFWGKLKVGIQKTLAALKELEGAGMIAKGVQALAAQHGDLV